MKGLLTSTILSMLLAGPSFGQEWIVGTGHGGFLLAHTTNIRHLQQGYISAFELSKSRRTSCTSCWQEDLKHPYESWSLKVQNYGYTDVLGYGISLNRKLDLFLYQQEKYQIAVQLGVGLSYFTRAYNAENNFQNNALGSKFNANLLLRNTHYFHLKKGDFLSASIGLFHSSNASLVQPNLGLNVPTISIGYGLKTKNQSEPQSKGPAIMTKDSSLFDYSINFGLGRKQVSSPVGAHHTILSLLSYLKYGKGATSLLLGVDVIFNSEHHDEEERSFVRPFPPETGLTLGGALNFNATSILLQTGFYITRPQGISNKLYHRFGANHRIKGSPVNVGLFLKWHQLRADYAEMTLGLAF